MRRDRYGLTALPVWDSALCAAPHWAGGIATPKTTRRNGAEEAFFCVRSLWRAVRRASLEGRFLVGGCCNSCTVRHPLADCNLLVAVT